MVYGIHHRFYGEVAVHIGLNPLELYAFERGVLLQYHVDRVELSSRADHPRLAWQRVQHGPQTLSRRCLGNDAVGTGSADEGCDTGAKGLPLPKPRIPCISQLAVPGSGRFGDVIGHRIQGPAQGMIRQIKGLARQDTGKKRSNVLLKRILL